MRRDANGNLHHPAGSPAARGGKFAPDSTPDAAVSLPSTPALTGTELAAVKDAAETEHIAALLIYRGVAADESRDILRTAGAASATATWENHGEGWHIQALDVRSTYGHQIVLPEKAEDQLWSNLQVLGPQQSNLGPWAAEESLDHTSSYQRTLEADGTALIGPRPTITEARLEQEAAWEAYRYWAAATAVHELRQALPDKDLVTVDVIEDDVDMTILYGSITDTSLPPTAVSAKEANRLNDLVADIGFDTDDIAGEHIWQLRTHRHHDLPHYVLRLDQDIPLPTGRPRR